MLAHADRRSFVSPTPPQAMLLFTVQRLLYNLSQARQLAVLAP